MPSAHGRFTPMGKIKEFVPIVGALVVIGLCALVPFAVGTGDDGLGEVRSATASLATINAEGQGLQVEAQQKQQELTEAIVGAAKAGETPKDIAKAVAPLLNIPEESAVQGVEGIIAQDRAASQPAPAPRRPARP
jgi:hypothetical protein